MHTPAMVTSIERNGRIVTLRLQSQLGDPKPGQFIMLWIPSVGEIPLSIADYTPGELLLVITRKGKVTTHIYENTTPGQRLHLRGPYGKPYTIPPKGAKTLLIGGGSGVASLHFLAKKLREAQVDCTAVLGFRSAEETVLEDSFSKYCRTIIATEDGSVGIKGLATDTASLLISGEAFDWIYACGPEPLIVKALNLSLSLGAKFEASLERYMRCAAGVCGSCILEPVGMRVCRDGPVFSGDILRKIYQ